MEVNIYNGTNGCQGQLQGPFPPETELLDLIRETANSPMNYLTQVGIQAPYLSEIKVNNIDFEIGKENKIEFEDTRITSIKIINSKKGKILIDFIFE